MGWLDDRIAATEASIEKAEATEAEILAGTVQRYSTDTGQTRVSADKLSLASLRKHIESLYNKRATLIARRDGSGSRTMRPDW